MDITPDIPAGRQVIESYGDGLFRISGRIYRGSLLLFPHRVVPWPVGSTADITYESLIEVTRTEPRVEILLVGCGPRMALMPGPIRRQLREAGVVTDPMDTGAACRTYNILVAEDRHVAAALIAVD